MTYEELRQLAGRLYARATPPADAPRRVEILALAEHIASVRLTAHWGVDFILLTNESGRWQVRHVVWQGSGAAD